jgi:NAD(P)-dependent dehydrogenase (short-subunit alcohol dehydrogenase family)
MSGDAAGRTFALQQRDKGGNLHPSVDDDYPAALTHQWGGPGKRWFDQALVRLPAEHGSQRGRRALVTGSGGGIGFFAAHLLAAVGMHVIIPARPTLEYEAHGAAAAIRAALPGAQVEVPEVPLDLASFASVQAFGAHMREAGKAIDVVCLNAARGGAPGDARETTADGVEAVMQVNLLSHMLLVRELTPSLRRSEYVRIVAHTSMARLSAPASFFHDLDGRGYSATPWTQFAASEAALCLYVRGLNLRLEGLGVNGSASVADPGFVATGLNYQNDVVKAFGFGRRGVRDVRSFHESHATHAADGSLPLTLAALEGSANEVWVSESPGPRFSSLDAAAHRASHLMWPPLRDHDPMRWPDASVEQLWSRATELVRSSLPKESPTGAASHEEL